MRPLEPNQIPEVGPPVVLPLPSPTKQTSNPNPGTEYVRVTVDAVPGPSGLKVYQSSRTGIKGADPAPPSSYNYPSIVLLISATPLLTPKLKDANNLESIKDVNGDNDVEWMDITFDLKAFDASNNEAKCTWTVFLDYWPSSRYHNRGIQSSGTSYDSRYSPKGGGGHSSSYSGWWINIDGSNHRSTSNI